MNLSDHYKSVGPWLNGSGPESDIIVSSRVRLARNIAGFLFLSSASQSQKKEIFEYIQNQIQSTKLNDDIWMMNINELGEVEKQILTERHLISRQLADGNNESGAAITHDETLSLMINEEDHLRIQAMSSGLQLHETYKKIVEIDNILEEKLPFSFSPQYGYLTACPTNVGTGIRVSVMLHLPALKISEQMDKVLRSAKDLGLAVRGLYGEGSEPVGDFYQLSNQVTLGKCENKIIDELIELAINPMIEYERRARQKLLEKKSVVLDDKIHRACGILSNARMISSDETLYMLSYIRLGIYLGRIQHISLETTNKLLLLTQPAHLQFLCQKNLTPNQRDEYRAELIREHINTH